MARSQVLLTGGARLPGAGVGACRQPTQLQFEDVAIGNPAQSGLHYAVAVQDQCRGRLQHMEVPRDVGAMGQIHIQVPHARAGLGHRGQRPVSPRTASAPLGAELKERRGLAQAGRP